MKLVADENIPYVSAYFSGCDEILLKSGRDIRREDLFDADILLVRSITNVNQSLLQDTPVKFVASATAGFDHMDTQWLEKAGIKWSYAKGCNAEAVVEYVICVIAALQKQQKLFPAKLRAAVIGVGDIGSRVAEKLTAMQYEVILCDPLRAEQEADFLSCTMNQITDVDLITLHVPLTSSGLYPTYHMIEASFLQAQKPGCVLINASRGAVIDSTALLQHGKHLTWCLDVFEHEPDIDLTILHHTAIATPHIAGYSVQGKMRGTEMVYQAAVREKIIPAREGMLPVYPRQALVLPDISSDWRDVVLQIFNPVATSSHMKEAFAKNPRCFDELRKHFTERYEFAYVTVNGNHLV